MKTETTHILDQLAEAINAARSTGKIMYVFREEDRWWYCGRLPYEVAEYYIAYPTGHSDRSSSAAEITCEDWNHYWQSRGGKPIYALPQVRGRKKAAAAQQKEKEQRRYPMNFDQMKRYFITYCAFAPHLALAACMVVCRLLDMNSTSTWSMALPVCLVCVPLTLLWVLSALHRPKSETLGIIGATLAIEAHFAFYVHLALISTSATSDSGLFLFTVIGSLAFSGVALLLLWDNQLPKPLPTAEAHA